MPLPPPGPGTFIVLPPTLEAYRVQLEKKRTLLEMSLDANRVSKSEYETELSEYRRNIVIYKKASTLVLSAGDRAGGRE
jgi:hypothetical protein